MDERNTIIKEMSQLKQELYGNTKTDIDKNERQEKRKKLECYEIILSEINKIEEMPANKKQDIQNKRKKMYEVPLLSNNEGKIKLPGIYSFIQDPNGQYQDSIVLYRGYSQEYKTEFLVYLKQDNKDIVAIPIVNIYDHLVTYSMNKVFKDPMVVNKILLSFKHQFFCADKTESNFTSVPSIIGHLGDKQTEYVNDNILNINLNNESQNEISQTLTTSQNNMDIKSEVNMLTTDEPKKALTQQPDPLLSKPSISLIKDMNVIYYYKTKLPWYNKTVICIRDIFQYLKEMPTLSAGIECLYTNETSEMIIYFSVPIEQLEFDEKYWSKGKDEWLTFLSQNFEQVDEEYLKNKYNPDLSINDLSTSERLMFELDLVQNNPSANIKEKSEQEKYRITSEIPLSELTTENTWPFFIDKDGYIIRTTQKLSKYSFDFLKKDSDDINHIDDSQTNIDDDPFFFKTEILNYIDEHIVKNSVKENTETQDTIISSKSDNTNVSSNPIQDETLQALLEQNRLLLEQNKMLSEQIRLMQNMMMGQNKQDISNIK